MNRANAKRLCLRSDLVSKAHLREQNVTVLERLGRNTFLQRVQMQSGNRRRAILAKVLGEDATEVEVA